MFESGEGLRPFDRKKVEDLLHNKYVYQFKRNLTQKVDLKPENKKK
jgi:hypothetical protein